MSNIGAYMHTTLPPHVWQQGPPGWEDPSVIQLPSGHPAGAEPWPHAPHGKGEPPVLGHPPHGWPPAPGSAPSGWPGAAERIERYPIPAPAPGTSGWRPPVIDGPPHSPAPPQEAADQPYRTGALVTGGARGFLVPYALGGAMGGVLALVSGRSAGHAAGILAADIVRGVAIGAGSGLAVAASRPGSDDSLAVRFGIAGTALGTGAALLTRNPVAAGALVLGGLSGGIVGAFTGHSLQRRLEAEGAR